ncbi:MAG: hypothetical protein EYC62_04250 [Alphaproteobacteria bacterium]|nr:MAG: hypothetical protein EYC62_04250 [Alphaproteobacteria bacterium]
MLARCVDFLDFLIFAVEDLFSKRRKPRVIATHYDDGHFYKFEALDHAGEECVGTVCAPNMRMAVRRVCGYEYALLPTKVTLEKPLPPTRIITHERNGDRYGFKAFDKNGYEKFGTIRASSPIEAATLLRRRYRVFPAAITRAR